MTVLLILNEAPYGSERSYNALRLAMAMQKGPGEVDVRIFLLADAVGCAVAGQGTPQGLYNVERMLGSVLAKGGRVSLCGTCADARGLTESSWLQGAARGSMDQLATWTVDADRVLTF
jgi:uncharacterized protein involved in oxidation of intracellular sulfur